MIEGSVEDGLLQNVEQSTIGSSLLDDYWRVQKEALWIIENVS